MGQFPLLFTCQSNNYSQQNIFLCFIFFHVFFNFVISNELHELQRFETLILHIPTHAISGCFCSFDLCMPCCQLRTIHVLLPQHKHHHIPYFHLSSLGKTQTKLTFWNRVEKTAGLGKQLHKPQTQNRTEVDDLFLLLMHECAYYITNILPKF